MKYGVILYNDNIKKSKSNNSKIIRKPYKKKKKNNYKGVKAWVYSQKRKWKR